jgi:hypothetical protein
MTLPYGKGDNKELFRFSLFLVFCNRLVAALIALATMLVRPSGEGEPPSLAA